MEIKKSTLYLGLILLILVVGGFFFLKIENSTATGNVVLTGGQVLEGEMQRVVVSQQGYNYNDVVVEAGKPIVLSADNSVKGCFRSVVFNIEGKKYSKYLQTNQDTLELPALSKGTYQFSCSMGMGLGKLIVN
jgi:plastocyanin domain-containing protein